MLQEILQRITTTYSNNPQAVRNDVFYEAPRAIQELAHISDSFKVYGGTGQGGFAKVPWIGILDKDITSSVQRGYYIVYLFNATGKGVYLSLNQRWTEYQKEYGTKKGRQIIQTTALRCRELIHSSLSGFPHFKIDLDASTKLVRGYELGHICGKFYPVDSIPQDTGLADDLRGLIGIYEEMKGYLLRYDKPLSKLSNALQDGKTNPRNGRRPAVSV